MAVAGGIGVAFAGKGESAVAVDELFADGEFARFVGIRSESLVGIDFDAAKSVDDADDGAEADLQSVVYLDTEEVF